MALKTPLILVIIFIKDLLMAVKMIISYLTYKSLDFKKDTLLFKGYKKILNPIKYKTEG